MMKWGFWLTIPAVLMVFFGFATGAADVLLLGVLLLVVAALLYVVGVRKQGYDRN